MRSHWTSLFSAFGIPVLGLSALLISLWHPSLVVKPATTDQPMMLLLDPDPRMDKVLTVCLRQEAKEVARCRARVQAAETQSHTTLVGELPLRRSGLAQAVSDYNLVARECTPAVFQTTHLPASLPPDLQDDALQSLRR